MATTATSRYRAGGACHHVLPSWMRARVGYGPRRVWRRQPTVSQWCREPFSNVRGGLRIAPKTACDLRFHLVAGAGFEPATSGRDRGPAHHCRSAWTNVGFLGLLRRNLTDRASVYRSVPESWVIVCGRFMAAGRIRRVQTEDPGSTSRAGPGASTTIGQLLRSCTHLRLTSGP